LPRHAGTFCEAIEAVLRQSDSPEGVGPAIARAVKVGPAGDGELVSASKLQVSFRRGRVVLGMEALESGKAGSGQRFDQLVTPERARVRQ
jgi:hypothetical protein